MAEIKKELCEEYSLIRDLLSRDKKYLHPVAAMLQLCKLKKELKSKKETSQLIWADISRDGKVHYESDELYNLSNASVSSNSTSGHKGNNGSVHQQYKTQDSFYQSQVSADSGKHFENMDSQFKKDGAYMHSRSDARADVYYIKKDAEALVKKLFDNASNQMFYLISSRLDECVETLIKNYRSFFGRFEKERENLHELTKNALNRDSKDKGALINVFSTVESKEKIAKKVENLSGPASDEELTDRDNIVGGSVFETIYKKSIAEKNEDLVQFNDKDAKPYTSLFDSMVESYKEVIVKGDAFAEINSYNVIQAIMESVDDPTQKKALLEETFAKACGLANPQISLDKANDNEEVVQQSEITVFLMSKQTAVFIKRHTEELGIKIDDEDTDEDSLITACAKQFIAQYSKQPTVRLALANNIPDYIIYCTGEIMDISPLRIPQFNEASSGQDGIYYTNYKEAIRLGKKYDTDMWNPHLGYNLNKQCNLPYINTNVGEEKDRILVKALLSLLNEGKLVYGKQKGADETRNSFIFTDENGIEKKVYVKNSFGVYSVVDENNIAELMNWMREFEEEKLERYAKMLDERILSEMQKLPTVINENDTKNLLGKIDSINITSKKDENKTFMMLLCKRLFTIGEKEISIIDFAFKIKNSEENSNDYDDAERILKTANEIFEEIVRYRTNPEENKQLYVRTATKAYGHIYKWIAIKALKNIGSFGGLISDAEKEYASITTWMTSTGAFRVRKEEDYMREDMDNFEEYKFTKACADVPAEVVDEVLKKASQAKIDEAKKYGLIKNNSKVEDKVESIEEQTEENSEE